MKSPPPLMLPRMELCSELALYFSKMDFGQRPFGGK